LMVGRNLQGATLPATPMTAIGLRLSNMSQICSLLSCFLLLECVGSS
jgi:hypothetical protein